MPVPLYCPRPDCPNHRHPLPGWRERHGTYFTIAHGVVQRYRCTTCGKTMGDQTESLHYYAKRRLPLKAVWTTLAGGACLREVAVRYGTTPMAIQSAVLRLGRQAMAAQAHLLHALAPRTQICMDGLRSFVTSQDYPCDLTTVVDRPGETILSISHTITRRGGNMTPVQRRRAKAKYALWRPASGSMKRQLSCLLDETWDYLRPAPGNPVIIDTDEHPLYRHLIAADPRAGHFRQIKWFYHRRTPGSAPRTPNSSLFPVNYVDMLLRHRVKEHMRETIAFGRHASLQMHRAWLFAWEHNARRPWRVRRPELGPHAVHGRPGLPAAVDSGVIRRLKREFFSRRIRLLDVPVPMTLRDSWLHTLPTPPVHWRKGQAQKPAIRLPKYAKRDLAQANPQGS